LILFDNVLSISYLFASRQTYGYVTPHAPAFRVDSIIECLLHCIRRENFTSVCYNIYGNRCKFRRTVDGYAICLRVGILCVNI